MCNHHDLIQWCNFKIRRQSVLWSNSTSFDDREQSASRKWITLEKRVSTITLQDELLHYNVEWCWLRKFVSTVLQMVRCSKLARSFRFCQNNFQVEKYHVKKRSWDMYTYLTRGKEGPYFKNSYQKMSRNPRYLLLLGYRWEPLAIEITSNPFEPKLDLVGLKGLVGRLTWSMPFYKIEIPGTALLRTWNRFYVSL